jgi:dephospho-CoA kinase
MFTVGLTGGIASGKSTVARLFAELGVPVVDADEIAREVVMPGEAALTKLVALFGEDILDTQGHLNREAMRSMVFADDTKRSQLEAVLHPAIGLRMAQAIAKAKGPYLILMVPLLVETGQHRLVNRVLVVDVPEQVQMARLMQRDGIDESQAQAMLAAQASRAQRLAQAHDVIHNDRSLAKLPEVVHELHAAYLQMAQDPQARARRFNLPAS